MRKKRLQGNSNSIQELQREYLMNLEFTSSTLEKLVLLFEEAAVLTENSRATRVSTFV